MRKAFFNKAFMVLAAAGSLMLTSCHDSDVFDPNKLVKEYEKGWDNKFGAIDPNHDWSLATAVTATVNIPNATGNSVLNIYTENPVYSTSKLLAKTTLSNGSGSIVFDVLKGTDQVYCVVRNDGRNIISGWADIVDGTVDASKTVAKKAARTRAASDVTKGETTYLNIACATDHQATYIRNGWDGSLKLFSEVKAELDKKIQEAKESGNYSNLPQEFSNKQMDYYSIVTGNGLNPWDAGYEIVSIDYSNAKFYNNFTFAEKIGLTLLNNVAQTGADPWVVSWGWELFADDKAFFKEYDAYYKDSKKAIPGYDLAKVEQGFSITTEGGEINVPFIFGSTQIDNRFGYVY